MDIKKNWEKYNIPATKTVEELLLKNSSVGAGGIRTYGTPNLMNEDAGFVAIFAGIVVVGIILVFLSFGFNDGRNFVIVPIMIAIIFVLMIVIFNKTKNIALKYDTDPKLSDSKKKNKGILTRWFGSINTMKWEKSDVKSLTTGLTFFNTQIVQMNKAKKVLTKMCEAGNFIGFERLYPQVPSPIANSWHSEIIENKNYPSIAYGILLDNKIFNDYIKQNDVNATTIEVLIELGMDSETE